jgi:rhodanese-related sulfurtransferase
LLLGPESTYIERRFLSHHGAHAVPNAELPYRVYDLDVYDVRTRAEFEGGHLPGSQRAEGGQLVQGVDKWVGTRNARIVLIDDADGVRAAITASWLIQIGGREVYVHTSGLDGAELETRSTNCARPRSACDPGGAATRSAPAPLKG